MSNWTDETKAKVIEAYLKAEPTPENSMEIVEALAEEFDASPNGVRMILSKAEVYVKKTAATASKTAATSDKPASTRVSKESAQAGLVAAIQKAGKAVDSDIISKLTGKAAVYFTEILS
jgi:transposase-like protein